MPIKHIGNPEEWETTLTTEEFSNTFGITPKIGIRYHVIISEEVISIPGTANELKSAIKRENKINGTMTTEEAKAANVIADKYPELIPALLEAVTRETNEMFKEAIAPASSEESK